MQTCAERLLCCRRPALTVRSSTLRPIGSIAGVSAILDAPLAVFASASPATRSQPRRSLLTRRSPPSDEGGWRSRVAEHDSGKDMTQYSRGRVPELCIEGAPHQIEGA